MPSSSIKGHNYQAGDLPRASAAYEAAVPATKAVVRAIGGT
jgi:hypothetical protein